MIDEYGRRLRSGAIVPSPGFGTWRLGEGGDRSGEIAALRYAYDLGFRHFDTAEMYADGESEALLGEAFEANSSDGIFITSKFYPWHADAKGVQDACDRSLKRLGRDHIDLYLLHWPGSVPFEETLAGAEKLLDAGKIRAFGVSNFDNELIGELVQAGLHEKVDANQVLYNPARRGIEYDLLPSMKEAGIVCIAYTPIEPDRMKQNTGFSDIAAELRMTPAELALAWHITRSDAVPIPKSATLRHIEGLARACTSKLSKEVLSAIDDVFPSPKSPQPLDII